MKIIRDKAPLFLLFMSLVFTVLKYYDIYLDIFKYLGDLLGYSIVTNLFMLSVYMNKKYCTSTKISVIGLIALNVFNIIYLMFGVNGVVYDFFIILIIILISIIYKYKI